MLGNNLLFCRQNNSPFAQPFCVATTKVHFLTKKDWITCFASLAKAKSFSLQFKWYIFAA